MPDYLDSVEACVEQTIARVGSDLVIGAPLGLGKPVQLMNAFYRRAAGDPSITLHFITALSLEVPKPASELEASLAGPIMERLFGDYEELAFLRVMKGWRDRWMYVRGYFATDATYAARGRRSGLIAQSRYLLSRLRSR